MLPPLPIFLTILGFCPVCYRTCSSWNVVLEHAGALLYRLGGLKSLVRTLHPSENFLLVFGSDGGGIGVTPARLVDSCFKAMLVNLQMHSSICLFNSVELEQVSGSNQLALCILMVLLLYKYSLLCLILTFLCPERGKAEGSN